jgi:hypothetical protein
VEDTSSTSALRTRLLALRSDLIDQLAEADTLEPSWLGTLAGIAAALDDSMQKPGEVVNDASR